jgi:hypothetical protein
VALLHADLLDADFAALPVHADDASLLAAIHADNDLDEVPFPDSTSHS